MGLVDPGVANGGPNGQPEYAFTFYIVPVITEFIGYEKYYKNTAGNTNGQTQDIDDGSPLLFGNISECEFNIGFDHDRVGFRITSGSQE